MARFYKATKEGFDGKEIRKRGDVFLFPGQRGSWMIPCDEHGNVTETVVEERQGRLGTKVSSALSRDDLREECRKRGITFKATMGASDLAVLLQEHDSRTEGPSAPAVSGGEGAAPAGGSGDQDVL